jgi:hypothetical protein
MATKRALIVGVSKFAGMRPELPGALKAATEWASRLHEYGYKQDDIHVLPDGDATLAAVKSTLTDILLATQNDDDIALVFATHGIVDLTDPVHPKYGLLLSGGSDSSIPILYDHVLLDMLKTASLGENVLLLGIVDACNSGGMIGCPPAPSRVKRLTQNDRNHMADLRDFFDLALNRFSKDFTTTGASTMLIASVRSDEQGYEGELDGERWMYFSYACLQALRGNPDQSYRTLKKEGIPLYLDGDEPIVSAEPSTLVDAPFARRTAEQDDAAAAKLVLNDGPFSFDVVFGGLSCLSDAPTDVTDFKKRVLFPTDDQWTGARGPHVGIVEFKDEDLIDLPSTIPRLSAPYLRGETKYRRIQLNGHRITVDNIIGDYKEDISEYRAHVPRMTMMQQDLPLRPRAECFLPSVPAWLISGYFDITKGFLTIKKAASYLSKILPKPPNTFPDGYYAIDVLLRMTISSGAPVVRVEDVVTGDLSLVRLKPTAQQIRVGNYTAATILGDETGEDPPADAKLFYKLSAVDVNPKPTPTKPTGIEAICIPVNWP